MGSQQQTLRLRPARGEAVNQGTSPTTWSRGRVVRYLLLTASVMVVVVVAWRAWPEMTAAMGVLRTVSPGLLALAVALEVLAVAALPQVYRGALTALGAGVAYRQGLQVSMGAFTLSRVLPGGGAAGALWAARRLQRFGVAGAVAGTAVVLAGVLAMATLGVIVTVGTVLALFRGHVSVASVVTACIVAAVFAGLGWLALVLLRSAPARRALFGRAQRIAPRLAPRLAPWERALDDLSDSLPGVRALRPVVGWSAVNWLLEIAALWMVFAGLGPHMEFGVLIVGYGVANLVTALPHTPGGLGLVEAGMAGTYVALGTETAVALAAVLAYRLISFWLPVLCGVPQYLRGPAVAEDGSR